jgi:hypothetical protein
VAANGQSIFAAPLFDLGHGNFVDALDLSVLAYNDIFVSVPEFLSLGLTDTLLGL